MNDLTSSRFFSHSVISEILHGKDKETRAEVAFATITAKISSSISARKWNYIVKNLIILNMCVNERIFLIDICNLGLRNVVNFKDEDEKISLLLFLFRSNGR